MPFATGGFGDVYKGIFRGRSRVCIKRIRVTGQDFQEKAKVHFPRLALPVRDR